MLVPTLMLARCPGWFLCRQRAMANYQLQRLPSWNARGLNAQLGDADGHNGQATACQHAACSTQQAARQRMAMGCDGMRWDGTGRLCWSLRAGRLVGTRYVLPRGSCCHGCAPSPPVQKKHGLHPPPALNLGTARLHRIIHVYYRPSTYPPPSLCCIHRPSLNCFLPSRSHLSAGPGGCVMAPCPVPALRAMATESWGCMIHTYIPGHAACGPFSTTSPHQHQPHLSHCLPIALRGRHHHTFTPCRSIVSRNMHPRLIASSQPQSSRAGRRAGRRAPPACTPGPARTRPCAAV